MTPGRATFDRLWTGPRSGAKAAVACLVIAATVAAGCGKRGMKDDPILRLSAEEALDKGKELLEAKKYRQAQEYFSHSFEVAPNSAAGREGLLLAADSLYLDGGDSNFIRAEAKYRDFQNRFPTSDAAVYAQLQIANSLAKRKLKPDRDQTVTRNALDAYQDLIRLYPDSQFAEEAKTQAKVLRSDLAEHEYIIGRYNFRRRLYRAAISRLEALIEDYPDFPEMDKVLFYLGMAQLRGKQGDLGAAVFERLEQQHPDSKFVDKVPARKAEP